MARPQKMGVDYFPLDVANDVKLDLIEAEFGLTGFAVVVKLFQRIYEFGYYCEWNDEVALLFAKKVGLGGSAVSEIVSAAIRRSLFDESIYKKYGVLTSRGIQTRYFDIVARRKNVEVEQRYLLVPHAQLPVNVIINSVNADIMYSETQVNACNNEQSKVKESKGKESKVKDVGGAPAKPTRHKHGLYKNVLLSDEELEKLKTEFPADWADRIERLSAYIESKGAKYKNHLATIREWKRREDAKNAKPCGNSGQHGNEPRETHGRYL